MSEYAEQFGVVRPASPEERRAAKVKPKQKPKVREHKSAGVKLGQALTLALRAGKPGVR